MALLIRPKTWTFLKPPPGALINWGHPLALGLVSCLHTGDGGASWPDLATSLIPTPYSAAGSVVVGQQGSALHLVKANKQNIAATVPYFGPTGADTGYSYEMRVRTWQATNGAFMACERLGTANSTNQTGTVFGVGGTTLDTAGTNLITANEDVAWHATSYTLTTGVWYHILATFTKGNVYTIYVNGVSQLTWTQAPNTAVTFPFQANCGGYHSVNGPTDRFTDCEFPTARVWNRVLSQSEVQWLYAEPYAFMMPQTPTRRYLSMSSSEQWGALPF